MFGIDAVARPHAVKRLMGVMPQEATLYWGLSVRHHLRIFAKLRGLRRRAAARRCEELIAELGLQEHRDKSTETLSGGLRRRVLLGIAAVADSPLLILDEPSVGLDPEARRDLWELLRSYRQRGKTVLLSTPLPGGGGSALLPRRHHPARLVCGRWTRSRTSIPRTATSTRSPSPPRTAPRPSTATTTGMLVRQAAGAGDRPVQRLAHHPGRRLSRSDRRSRADEQRRTRDARSLRPLGGPLKFLARRDQHLSDQRYPGDQALVRHRARRGADSHTVVLRYPHHRPGQTRRCCAG